MKPKSMLLLCVAGICGLIAAVFTAQHLAGNEPIVNAAPTEAHKAVVVAVQDISPGVSLKEDMIKVVEMPTKDLPEGTFTAVAELTGQRLRFPVFKGEPVLAGKLGRGLSTLAGELRPGMKACTVSVSQEERHMTGLINPGDRVDVYWIQLQQDLSNTSLRLLLQDVKVLAVGHHIDGDAAESSSSRDTRPSLPDNYTLEVLPVQNMRVQAALFKGKIRLSLRSTGDTTIQDLDEKSLDLVLGLMTRPVEKVEPTPEPTPEPTREQWEVEYVRGNESSKEVLNVPEPRMDKSKNSRRN